jgi:N-acetylneuraminate synthase/sialic acid synthase
MVDVFAKYPISAIKTAKRDIDSFPEWKDTPYINRHSYGKTYYEHRKALELSKKEFVELKKYVESAGLDFISSFTDENSLDFLFDIGIKYLKVPSQRMKDKILLSRAASTDIPTILSAGMCDQADVDEALAFFWNLEKYLLQCTSVYPCPEELLNLKVLESWIDRYSYDYINGFGLSGHHVGIAPDILAYGLGADIIERHVTLCRASKGTDQAASLEPKGVEMILKYIAQCRAAMGSGNKKILPEELPAIKKLRGE